MTCKSLVVHVGRTRQVLDAVHTQIKEVEIILDQVERGGG